MTECRETPALLIYTDASWHRNGAAWGAVIRGLGEELQRGAQFRKECAGSDLAELWGVANALHIAIADGRIRRGISVLVLCDNLTVVQRLNGQVKGRPSRRSGYKAAVSTVTAIVRDCRATVTFKWVKGHQTEASDCPHKEGNTLADQIARKANGISDDAKKKRNARRNAKRIANRKRKIEAAAAEQAVSHGA